MSCTLVRTDHFPPVIPATRAKRKEMNRNEPLAHALAALHIRPLDEESVKSFKEDQLDRHMQSELVKIDAERTVYKIRIMKNLAWISAAALLCICFSQHLHQSFNPWSLGACALIIYLSVEKLFREEKLEIAWQQREAYARKSQWVSLGYETYKNEPFAENHIPHFVQETVKQIRARLPKARFDVEFFCADPILAVWHWEPGSKDEFFYLYAWDEKGFVVP